VPWRLGGRLCFLVWVVNTKEKLDQAFYESAKYYAKLCDIFALKCIRLRNFYKNLMLSSTLVVGYIS
jgi:hypothetical protein